MFPLFFSFQVPPPPGTGDDSNFEFVNPSECGENQPDSGDRNDVYRRLQDELINQIKVTCSCCPTESTFISIIIFPGFVLLLYSNDVFVDRYVRATATILRSSATFLRLQSLSYFIFICV